MHNWAAVGGGALLVAGVLTLLWKLARGVWRLVRNLVHIVDRLLGRQAIGSTPAAPGALDRLDALTGTVGEIRAQVFPNGGSSLRDAVDGLARKFDDHMNTLHVRVEQTGPIVVTPGANASTQIE
jgi:hypothetical protein